MLVKITLFAALLLSIVVPFAYFLSGTKNKARYKLTIGTNAAAFFGIMLVACGFMFSGNAQAAEAAAEAAAKNATDNMRKQDISICIGRFRKMRISRNEVVKIIAEDYSLNEKEAQNCVDECWTA